MQRDLKDYQGHDMRTRVYNSPDMYVGSPVVRPKECEIYSITNNRVEEVVIDTPDAVRNIFVEVIANAIDNTLHSVRQNIPVRPIIVTMSNKVVSVSNGGIAFPIEKAEFVIEGSKQKEKLWVIQASFGRFNTSTNYNDNRSLIGKNGFGGKSVNTYSIFFQVDAINEVVRKSYSQCWGSNMTIVDDPIIEKCNKKNMTKVTYELDFPLFSMKEYSQHDIYSFANICYDSSFASNVKFIFRTGNDEVALHPNINEYCKLHGIEGKYIEWEESETLSAKNKYTPDYFVRIYDTPHNGRQYTFVNGKRIRYGGTLTDSIVTCFASPIVKTFNKKGSRIKCDDVRQHITIIIVASRFVDALYDNQSKERLTNNVYVNCSLNIEELTKSWNLISAVKSLQQSRTIKNTKKEKNLVIDKGRDANFAGTNRSKDCVLGICEGTSGGSLLNSLIAMTPHGKDTWGSLFLRGKSLNVRKLTSKTASREENNPEIIRFMKMMGLKYGRDYRDPKMLNTLRYNKISIFADRDDDGFHIIGLVVDFLAMRFPGILFARMVVYPVFPYIEVKLQEDSKMLQFYSLSEYTAWHALNNNITCTVNLFKGLGSYEKRHIEEYYNRPIYFKLLYGQKSESKLRIVFSDKCSDERKEWMFGTAVNDVPLSECQPISCQYDKDLGTNMESRGRLYHEPIYHFVDTKLRSFSLTALHRSIPWNDGLKSSQRDIVYAALCKWKPKVGKINYDSIKLLQFSGYCAELTHYPYGEQSIPETVKKMFLNYVGKNNFPYFEVIGGVGSREDGGSDCPAARYLKVKPSWWIPYVFRNKDNPLLKMIEEEGKLIKPLLFRPIVPLSLINGAKGTGSGWSTTIPRHHPVDIIDYYINMLNNEKTTNIFPWYRGFKGDIKIKTKNIPDQDNNIRYPVSVVTRGVVEFSDDKVIITELPIGCWTKKYVDELRVKVKEKNSIAKIRDLSSNNIHIELTPLANTELLVKDLKLTTYIPLTNLVLLDDNGTPIRHNSIYDILDDFYHLKIKHYTERKAYYMSKLKAEVKLLQLKQQFVEDVKSDRIILRNRPRTLIIQEMEKSHYPASFLKLGLSVLTNDNTSLFEKEIEFATLELRKLSDLKPEDIWFEELIEFRKACLQNDELK